MKNQSTITDNNLELCSHISKLAKKSIEGLPLYNYIPFCGVCKALLNKSDQVNNKQININLCLHCGAVFCHNQKCLESHQKDTHLFYAKLMIKENPPPSLLESEQKYQPFTQNNSIFCRICGDVHQQAKIDFKSKGVANLQQKEEAQKKLLRFVMFISQVIEKNLCQVLINKFNQYEQLELGSELPVFGFKNLGNTCFLNSVLQVLYYTSPFSQIYLNLEKISLDCISSQKKKRRQIQFYYDQIIQKQQSSQWRVVSDKKTKSKQKMYKSSNIQKFASEGLVKDNKFNGIMSKFLKNINQFLLQNDNSKEKIIFEPIQILMKLTEYDHKYDRKQEQDAEQLLIFMIDIINQGEMISMLGKNQERKQRYKKAENLIGRQKISPVQQIFGSYLASHIVCLGCKKQSWTIDFTYHYPICIEQNKYTQKSMEQNNTSPIQNLKYYKQLYYPQPKKQAKSILNEIFKPQRLTNKQNYYKCQKCSGLSAIKQFYALDPPEILLVSFKRFQHNKKYKISKHVPFQEFVNLNGFVLREKDEDNGDIVSVDYVYQLYGLIVHKGETITSGHYKSFVKIKAQEKNKQKYVWFEFSDQKIRKITFKQILRQEAYILAYKRVHNENISQK